MQNLGYSFILPQDRLWLSHVLSCDLILKWGLKQSPRSCYACFLTTTLNCWSCAIANLPCVKEHVLHDLNTLLRAAHGAF